MSAQEGVNDAETYAYDLARRSFLSLWSYLNPRRPDHKETEELCDVLVVFDRHILIFSVKDIELKEHEDPSVPAARWQRRAIDGNVKQLDGAHRVLEKIDIVLTKSGEESLPLPVDRSIHRIAVAFGSKGEVPLIQGNMGRGFTHVFDEAMLQVALEELDTITDFVEYLEAKEAFFSSDVELIVNGDETDLLGWYLMNGRKFDTSTPDGSGASLIIIDEGIWDEYTAKAEYREKKLADKASYAWDFLITYIAKPHVEGHPECVGTLSTAEQTLRVMASERRFNRRILGNAHYEFHQSTEARKELVNRRVMKSPSGVLYVFQGVPEQWERSTRTEWLKMTAHVARRIVASSRVLAISNTNKGWDSSQQDVLYLEAGPWTDEDEELKAKIQAEFGILVNTKNTRLREDEYPKKPTAG